MLIDSEYISIYFTVCSVEVGIASEVSDRWEIEEFESECEHPAKRDLSEFDSDTCSFIVMRNHDDFTTGSPSSSCEVIILHSDGHGGVV